MPSSSRDLLRVQRVPQQAMAWSSAESESRTLPSPACASTAEHFGIGLDAFLVADPLHARDQLGEIHRPEAELLAARRDGRRDLVRLGGAQDEHHPLGRLFQRLQQRVEGFVGDLVRFVDDEDFVAVARGAVAHVLAQLAHFIDAAIGGRVDLDHVHARSGGDLDAARAYAAGLVASGP